MGNVTCTTPRGTRRPGPAPRREAQATKHARWARLLKDHHTFMRARALSPWTIRTYRYKLWELAERHPDPTRIRHEHLVELMAACPGNSNKRTMRSAYRSFFRWAWKAGHLASDPSDDLPKITKARRLPRPTPDPVIAAALREAKPREQFLIELGAFGGLRVGEMAQVHAKDWDRYRRRLTVHGKGNKDRVVPITDDELADRLDALTGWAFPNRWTGLPITSGHISKLLSRALSETWTGHTLRHWYGTEALKDTNDLPAVADNMGHEQVETTRLYTKISDDRHVAASAGAGRHKIQGNAAA